MQTTIRKAEEKDKARLSEWIAADKCPQHRGVNPEWWMDEGFAVENASGPVFYLKFENVMRCYIQFAPDVDRDQEVTKLALKNAFYQVAVGAKQHGYKEIIYDSESPSLIGFMKQFGFKEATNNFLVRI
jgi:hypothetical protein